MEKTIHISICGVSFLIETDAYKMLQEYLEQLQKMYGSRGAEGKEIIDDIEARIAELILSRQADISVPVTKSCIEEIVNQLGMPSEADSDTVDGENRPNAVPEPPVPRFHKRLYRNMDGAKLGGVLNGLASYFNGDVAVFRAVFLLVLLFGFSLHFWWHSRGFGFNFNLALVLGYLFGWIIIPKAVTPRQKLEMTGEEITVSSIEDSFRREIDYKSNSPKNTKSASIFANLVYAVCRIVRFVFLAFVSVVAVSISVIVVSLLIACGYALCNAVPLVSVFTQVNPSGLLVLVFAAAVVPLSFLLLLFIRMLFRFRVHWTVYTGFALLWIGLWVGTGTFAAKEMVNNSVYAKTVDEITAYTTGDTLYVKEWPRAQEPLDYSFDNNLFEFSLDKDYILVRNFIYFSKEERYKPSEFRFDYFRSAKGSSVSTADGNVRKIAPSYKMEGDTLYIDPYFKITAAERYNGQYSRFNIGFAPGQKVAVSPRLHDFFPWENRRLFKYNKADGYYYYTGKVKKD